mgnify:CR=1 FL=1
MKRLIIQKLIVISQIESRSLEIPFKRGLNIILGGNKTGKSSIIKSIFTTLGCDCKSIEADWKKLISSYLLFFDYGNKEVRYELSIPDGMSNSAGKTRIASWKERYIFEAIPFVKKVIPLKEEFNETPAFTVIRNE